MNRETERERMRTQGSRTYQPRKPGEAYPEIEPLCVCGHLVDDHGDGVVHTACCAFLTEPSLLEDMCECETYQAEQPA